ncbi:hypothetical protein [Corynebacterium oculi]|uniref:hypothetical protein n=1 Tax=Corynebacterium oculi TaxID=1544416 RepID=UPI001364CC33|nr:hypothetical protein [Corynebacterium oculi]
MAAEHIRSNLISKILLIGISSMNIKGMIITAIKNIGEIIIDGDRNGSKSLDEYLGNHDRNTDTENRNMSGNGGNTIKPYKINSCFTLRLS